MWVIEKELPAGTPQQPGEVVIGLPANRKSANVRLFVYNGANQGASIWGASVFNGAVLGPLGQRQPLGGLAAVTVRGRRPGEPERAPDRVAEPRPGRTADDRHRLGHVDDAAPSASAQTASAAVLEERELGADLLHLGGVRPSR